MKKKVNQVKMSLLPYILDDFYPTSCHRYGSGQPNNWWISPSDSSLLRSISNVDNLLRSQLSHLDEIERKSHIGKDGFQVALDVQHFQPNEISVKTENNSIVVHAKHEEKKDDQGFISREFTRRYALPEGFKVDDVTSTLSSDGVLSVKCPPAPALEASNVRQIRQTSQRKQQKQRTKMPKEWKMNATDCI